MSIGCALYDKIRAGHLARLIAYTYRTICFPSLLGKKFSVSRLFTIMHRRVSRVFPTRDAFLLFKKRYSQLGKYSRLIIYNIRVERNESLFLRFTFTLTNYFCVEKNRLAKNREDMILERKIVKPYI